MLTLLEIPAPGFDIELERERRKQAVIEADKNLSAAVEGLKTFQGQHYQLNALGRLVPRVSCNEVVSNEAIDRAHQSLVRAMSAANDEFQRTLSRYSEVSP
jgi:hypothetical protein